MCCLLRCRFDRVIKVESYVSNRFGDLFDFMHFEQYYKIVTPDHRLIHQTHDQLQKKIVASNQPQAQLSKMSKLTRPAVYSNCSPSIFQPYPVFPTVYTNLLKLMRLKKSSCHKFFLSTSLSLFPSAHTCTVRSRQFRRSSGA